MATTVTAPVNNNISLASRYLPILDEIYERGALTSVLDTVSDRVRWIGAKTVNLFNINMVGLADYSRNNGFVSGDTNGAWEPYTINVDRGRSYMVDVMDNDESVGMAFGALVGEAERTQIVPEVDAYRFAKYASAAGLKATPVTVSDSTNVADLIDAAEAEMNNAQVPYEGRILFVNPTAYKQLRKNITRMVLNGDKNVNNNIEMYNDMRIVQVPQSRFNTAVTLNTAANSSALGGYTLAGVPINFMIIHPSAILQVVKHVVPRVFSPEVNQEADAWKFDYRIYHDCWAQENKVNGIYLCASAPATAMSASPTSLGLNHQEAAGNITVSNSYGGIKAESTAPDVATVSVSGTTVSVAKVTAGSATVKITDGIGQSVDVSVTLS